MTTGSPLLPYAGLYELSAECWRCCASAVYMASASVPRFPTVGNAPGVLDDIRYFLENLLNAVSGSTISSWVRNTMLPLAVPYINWYLVDPFQDFIRTIRTALVSAFNWGAGLIHTPLAGISDLLGQIRTNFPGWLQSALTNGLWTLLHPLQAMSNDLTFLWQGLPGWLREPLTGLGNQVWASISSVGTLIGGYVDALRAGIAAAIANAMLVIHDPLAGMRTAADWLRTSLPGHLSMIGTTAVTQLWNTIMAALHDFWLRSSTACANITLAVLAVGTPLLKNLWAGVSSIPSTYLSWLVSTCGTDLALTPSRALTSVGGLYGMSIVAGTAAMVISAALNLIPTLNWVGAAQLAGLVSEAAAFDPLTKATYGVLINDVLTVPLRYHWNQQLRPYMPTIGEIYTMGRKHGLSMGEFQTAMAYQGIPNWWIDKIYDFFWTDPSPMWLLRMTEGGIPTITSAGRKGPWLDQWIPNWRSDPMSWLKMKLMLSGFEDIDIDPMISGMRMRSVTASVAGAKTAAKNMLHEAYWTEADAKAFLTPLGVRPEEVHMLAVAEELDYQKAYLDDQVSYYVAAFAKGQLTDQALNLALTTIYVKPARVAQVIAREQVRKLPTIKSVTPVELNPAVTRLRTQAINSWIDQYRAWQISEDDLLLSLTIIVQDPALAREMVNVEMTRFRPVPPKLPPPAEDPLLAASRRQAIATWVTAFRDGAIIADELELYLEPLIPNAALRKQLVALEKLRYSPTPGLIPPIPENEQIAKVRAEYVRGHIEMFAKRLITLEELYQFLLADGLVEPLARTTVITQATRRIAMPPIDSPYYLPGPHAQLIAAGLEMYEASYMAGEITLAQYEAWLTVLAADQDVVTYLADVLALRKFAELV